MSSIRVLSDLILQIAPAVANHLWQSTLVGAGASLLVLAVRQNQASVRHGIWFAASIKFLIPFALISSLGSHLRSPQGALVQPALYAAVEGLGQPVRLPAVASLRSNEPLSGGRSLPAILSLVWVSGCVGILLVWLTHWYRIRRLIGKATHVTDGPVAESLRRAEMAARIRDPIQLMESTAMMEPGIFGICKPILVWPSALSEHLEPEHIEAIFTHELRHIRRRDNLAAVFHLVVEAVFWFHPMTWWIGTRLVKERERACDEEVLETGTDPYVYAESILKVCALCIGSPLSCVSGITGADLKQRMAEVMSSRPKRRLNVTRKILLSASATIMIAAPLAYGLVQMVPISSQLLEVMGPRPHFEVTTVKPGRSGDFSFRLDPSAYSSTGQSLRDIIKFAYRIPSNTQLVDLPAWVDHAHFDLQGKMDEVKAEELSKLPWQERFVQIRLMVQSLLADRFHLKTHVETRKLPVFALILAKGGSKMTEVPGVHPAYRLGEVEPPPPVGTKLPPGTKAPMLSGRPGDLQANAIEIKMFTDWITTQPFAGEDRVILDGTGLKGNYDFHLQWEMDNTKEFSSAPAFSTALREQLGLQLQPAKGSVQVLVIEHIEKPTEN